MSLEALLNVEITSASRKAQRLSNTPAAVYVITQEDIRRSGLTSVPELLRLAPGVQVARIDASRWAISVRGFNDEFANKLLVLVDGRTVYTEIFSGVYWDMQDMLVEDIERIEVIRGPGATMWGANAVNGVINIITRNAADTQGALLTLAGGTEQRAATAFRFGGRAGRSTAYRFYTRFSDHVTPSTPSFRDSSWRAIHAGMRSDSTLSSRDSLMLQASIHADANKYYRNIGLLQPPWISRLFSDNDKMDGVLLARWNRRITGGEISLQASFDSTRSDEVWRNEQARTTDLEFQVRRKAGTRHELNWGAGIRNVSDVFTARTYRMTPPELERQKYSLFLQDEWALAPETLTLTAGTKLEHNYFTGWEMEPTVKLIWTPAAHQSVWTSLSRAVRTPSRADRGIFSSGVTSESPYGLPYVAALIGTPGFVSETLTAVELGYRRQFGTRLSLDNSWFLNRYRNLTGYRVEDPALAVLDGRPYILVPLPLRNTAAAMSLGTELSATLSLTEHWRVTGGYSWLRLRMRDLSLVHIQDQHGQLNFGGPNSPDHQGQIRTEVDLRHGLSLDAAFYRTASIWPVGVPAYSRLDSRLAWRASSGLELSLVGQNLTNSRHYEFLSEAAKDMYPIRRSAYLKLTFWF